jgi:hypothetical protein
MLEIFPGHPTKLGIRYWELGFGGKITIDPEILYYGRCSGDNRELVVSYKELGIGGKITVDPEIHYYA